MEAFRQLDPSSLEAQEALRNLLGTTLAQLNEIDKNIVGSSSNIRGVKTNLRDVLAHVPQAAPPPPSVPQPQYISVDQPAPAPVPSPAPVAHSEPVVQEDPNQLIFDFNSKVTPDVVDDKLDRILSKLNDIIELLKS